LDKKSYEEISQLTARIAELEIQLERLNQQRNQDQEELFALQKDAAERVQQLRKYADENSHLRGLLHSENYAGPDQLVVRPNYNVQRLGLLHNHGFLLMPFGPSWSDGVEDAVSKAMRKCGMLCHRADKLTGRSIVIDIWQSICECGVIIADITDCNANVTYELGLADALGKNVILISQTANPEWLAFDLLGLRLIVYSIQKDELPKLTENIVKRISERTTNLRVAKVAHVNG
jgi:hypothetical protein